MLSPLCRAIHTTSINLFGKERGEGDFERESERMKKRPRERNGKREGQRRARHRRVSSAGF